MEIRDHEVPIEKLRWQCDPGLFTFECTRDLAPLREFIGQDRAISAVEFGLGIGNDGYNIYVAGLTGTGKTSIVKFYIEKLIKEKQARGETNKLQDWCYLYNFQEPDFPRIVNLPQGGGKKFRDEISELLNRIKEDVGKAFSSEEYKAQSKKMVEEGRTEQQKVFNEIADEARQQGFAFQMSPMGPVLIPLVNGHPMEEREYLSLDEETKKKLEGKQMELRKKLQSVMERAGSVERSMVERIKNMDKEVGSYTVSRLFDPLLGKYADSEKVHKYLVDLKGYTLNDLDPFKQNEEPVNPVFGVPMSQMMGGRNPLLPFQVNVFIDNSEAKDIPVIVEANPNFSNMFGKIERRFLFGAYLSDHTMLKPGAISRANGGYLLLGAMEVLTNPAVWPALKRAIKNKEVRVEDPYEQFGLVASQGMRPEPMPLNVKIILIGDAYLYQMLAMYDEEFWEIFKVKADFNHIIDKTDKNIINYAAFLSGCCEECKTRHFDRGGTARAIEHCARMVEDQQKLSTRFARVQELVEEANYWASKEGAELISAEHVKKALEQRKFRHNLVEQRIEEMIDRGMLMIDVDGGVVGQVNGLSVYSIGDFAFGRPSRITARTYLGRSGVVNIERESQMSGRIHDKGVLILTGFLGWKFAQNKPLSLAASICFEQSYEGVEGDSASSTELYAILSSLSGVPIKQSLAVTGSVNQRGEIQPIGGVNEKIEGFFDVCKSKGLTGKQGVLIPHQNVTNLMLREEVVDAVKNGQFHIYSARNIDEGIEILTGVPAGERREDGTFPEGTVNYLVDAKLGEMADKIKGFLGEEKEKAKVGTKVGNLKKEVTEWSG